MSEPHPTNSVDSRSTGSPNPQHDSAARFRVLIVILVAAMIPAAAHMITARQSVRAQDAAQQDGKAPATHTAKVSPFIEEIQQFLRKQHDRMATIAAPMLAAVDAIDRLYDRIGEQRMAISAAQNNYQEAKFRREIAGIEVIAYKEGIAVQELAVAEGEVKLAKSDLEQARNNTAEAKTRLDRITGLADESAGNVSLVFMYTDRVKAAELGELKAKYVIEQAESKKKVLVQYTHPKRLKELESDIMKQHSVELGTHADWERQKSKLEKLERTIKNDKPTDDEKQVLTMLDQAVLLEDTVRAELDRWAKGGKTDPPVQKAILDLTTQLQNIVDRAEAVQSEAQFTRLRARIHQAAKR